MTVAAVILAASPETALADAEGSPSVRRLVDAAWAGGAVPVIVVAPDPDGSIAAALTNVPATLVSPAPSASGPAGQMAIGMDRAVAEVTGTDAALLWPARFAWVDPETVTSLIEAHGVDREHLLRPSYRDLLGWPVLVPVRWLETLRAVAPGLMPDEAVAAVVAAGVPERRIDVGDPGTTTDASTPWADLPPFEGPPGPAGGHMHEWGAAVAAAASPEDVPLEGPGLAPYGQAAAEVPDQPG